MYFAGLMEMGMFLGNSADQVATRVEVEKVLVATLEALLLPQAEK
jgi:hypothetical protein